MNTGYAKANGIRLFYVEEGSGPLVLLCHGFPEFWWSWRHQLDPIAQAGFRAVAIDLPGYGRSDKPDVVYDITWINRCLAELISSLGHDRAVMVGHDWGGLLVWPFARMYPDRTAGVIGLNTPDLPRLPVPTTEFLRQSGSTRLDYILQFQERGPAEEIIEADIDAFMGGLLGGDGTVQKDAFTEDVVAEYADVFRPKGAITPPLEYYRNMDRNWELLEEFDDAVIERPCLMISADSDPFLPARLTEGMESRVPNLTRVVIENCGHWTQQEQPEETSRAMVNYLSSLQPWS